MSNPNNAMIPLPQRVAVSDPVPIMDSARFEHMQRVALVMAKCSLIPESLYVTGPKNSKVRLEPEAVVANCFMIVNQAVRWGMDPFAVAQSASVVRGKLCFEGKLVAAVLEVKAGITLDYDWNDRTGDAFGITVSGVVDGKVRSIRGTVGEWKTTGEQSAWDAAKNHRRMLAYRGAREWARLYKPAVMLGVYSDDEMEDMADAARANRARPVADLPPMPPAIAVTSSPAPVDDMVAQEAAPLVEQEEEEVEAALSVEGDPIDDDGEGFANEPEDFDAQAAQIRELLEGAKTHADLVRVKDDWNDRVMAMPREHASMLQGVYKARAAALRGAS